MHNALRMNGGRSVADEVKSIGAVVGAALAVIVLAGSSASPILSKGVRAARAAPASSSQPSTSASALPVIASLAPPSSASAPIVIPPVTLAVGKGTRVLLFGDSFVAAGLQQRMKQLVEERGGTFFADAWTSSTTTAWAKGDRLLALLDKTKPDVVFISIGANEVFLPAPETRAPSVRAVVARLGARPCAWISPPLWKGETGITAVTHANSSPCAFFDSSALSIDHNPDKIHPSPTGGAAWAEAVWSATVLPAQP